MNLSEQFYNNTNRISYISNRINDILKEVPSLEKEINVFFLKLYKEFNKEWIENPNLNYYRCEMGRFYLNVYMVHVDNTLTLLFKIDSEGKLTCYNDPLNNNEIVYNTFKNSELYKTYFEIVHEYFSLVVERKAINEILPKTILETVQFIGDDFYIGKIQVKKLKKNYTIDTLKYTPYSLYSKLYNMKLLDGLFELYNRKHKLELFLDETR